MPTCPIPYSLWDIDQPHVFLVKGANLTPKVPLYPQASAWCNENLSPGWKAVFHGGDPTLICDSIEDVIHFQLRWGNSLGDISEKFF